MFSFESTVVNWLIYSSALHACVHAPLVPNSKQIHIKTKTGAEVTEETQAGSPLETDNCALRGPRQGRSYVHLEAGTESSRSGFKLEAVVAGASTQTSIPIDGLIPG